MAEIKTVSVTYGRKFNLGDYNSAHIEISMWADLDEGDNPDEVTEELWRDAKWHVKEQALPLISNQKAKVEQTFLGLPVEIQNQIMEDYNANQRTD